MKNDFKVSMHNEDHSKELTSDNSPVLKDLENHINKWMSCSKEEIEFLQESNKIEGVYDEDSLDQAIEAWLFLREQEEMTVSIILKTHKILMLHQNLQPDQKGYFRRCGVSVGGRLGLNWLKVPEAMEEWCLDAMTSIKVPGRFGNNIKLDHIEFEKIHPFVDGNGRVGRLLMYWEYLKANIPILYIKEKNRREYYKWFKD